MRTQHQKWVSDAVAAVSAVARALTASRAEAKAGKARRRLQAEETKREKHVVMLPLLWLLPALRASVARLAGAPRRAAGAWKPQASEETGQARGHRRGQYSRSKWQRQPPPLMLRTRLGLSSSLPIHLKRYECGGKEGRKVFLGSNNCGSLSFFLSVSLWQFPRKCCGC